MAADAQKVLRGNAVVGQSGGPTVVINQSLVGVVEGLRGQPGIEKILGGVRAVSGIVKDEYIELHDVPQDRLERLAQTPSSALGSSRDKPDAEYCARIVESFKRQNVRYFFYIGGNDSSDTCRIVSEAARKDGYELRAFHVPKTIDNDLMESDHTPGYGSAARFVACSFIGNNLDNRALPGVMINVVMGRHAGFLTAASILARLNEGDGPHLVYVPEVAFDIDRYLADVDAIYKKYGRCLIAVSEGVHDAAGAAMAVKLAAMAGTPVESDAHGNVQLSGSGVLGDFLADLVKKKLGIKRVRSDTFGYLQRSFAGCVSPTDADEARQVGRIAARHALRGESEGSICIHRTGNDPYRVDFKRIDLAAVAGKTRTLDHKFIVNAHNIDDRFKDYAAPLVGKLPVVESLRYR